MSIISSKKTIMFLEVFLDQQSKKKQYMKFYDLPEQRKKTFTSFLLSVALISFSL